MPITTEQGYCPTCGGEAQVFRNPKDERRGHVYCEEDGCGWIHRDLIGVDEYVTEQAQ